MSTALAGAKTLAAGTLCNILSTFLANVDKLGWSAAAAMLDPTYATAIITLAGAFGITQAAEGRKERKMAGELAKEIHAGAELRLVECEVLIEADQNHYAIVRDDTREVVQVRAMSSDDRQLFIREGMAKAPKEDADRIMAHVKAMYPSGGIPTDDEADDSQLNIDSYFDMGDDKENGDAE